MSSPRPTDLQRLARRGLFLLLLAAGLLCPALARADTVYLKNGRVLRAAKVTVTEDKVILEQAGNRIEFPRSLVERIEEDPLVSDVMDSRADRPADEDEAEGPDETGDAAEANGQEGEDDEAEEEIDPKETREYWQEAMLSLRDERQQLDERLAQLRREERAFLFSHRSTADVKRQIEQVETRLAEIDVEEQEFRREARRLQIPPGWLRIRGG